MSILNQDFIFIKKKINPTEVWVHDMGTLVCDVVFLSMPSQVVPTTHTKFYELRPHRARGIGDVAEFL